MPLFVKVYAKVFTKIIAEIQIILLTAKPDPKIIFTKSIFTKIQIILCTNEISAAIKTLICMFYLLITKPKQQIKQNDESTKQVGSLVAGFLSGKPEPLACVHVDVNLLMCHEEVINRITQMNLGWIHISEVLLNVAIVIEFHVVLEEIQDFRFFGGLSMFFDVLPKSLEKLF